MFALPFIIIVDLIVLNTSLLLFREIGWNAIPTIGLFPVNLYYIICVLCLKPYANKRFARIEDVATRSFETSLLFFTLLAINMRYDAVIDIHDGLFCILIAVTSFLLFWSRAFSRFIIKTVRRRGRGVRKVLFIGFGINQGYLFTCLSNFMRSSFIFMGYFDDAPSDKLPAEANYLGTVDKAISWMDTNKPNVIYCGLPESDAEDIVKIIKYCEKNFIQFYSVPNVRNYVHRTMRVKMIDDMPVLALRDEPLQKSYNRFIKRTFDLVFSGLFLVTCFWWIYIIVAIITKVTMLGPVFFRQKRNGVLGKEFYMIKFRSMKVNKDADTVQATKDDPRKTRWGNIMRKTNIDELPQFINVFRGDMSVVGPRPHMLKHTKEYSALIDKYMVRHWIKPGITGWAQVSGARGETPELWQMEERVEKDIWYMEHWSIWLDLRIILKTIFNTFRSDEQAY